MKPGLFLDRRDAGRQLAAALRGYAKRPDVLVLALPRGGVPVAYEVAKALSAPLDVFVVRKLGVPGHEELALGAIASGDTITFNEDIIQSLHLSDPSIQRVIQAEREELERRQLRYRNQRPPLEVKNKTVILVDDGIATGATMLAAVKSLTKQKPAELIIAVPVV